MSRHEALDVFGKSIIEDVRDRTIEDWQLILDRKMRDVGTKELWRGIKKRKFTVEQLAFLRDTVMPQIVDHAISAFLWHLYEAEWLTITAKHGSGKVDLREVSDGFAGDIWAWIPAYTKQGRVPGTEPRTRKGDA